MSSNFPRSRSSFSLPDVLEVRREVGQGAAAVHLLAGGAVGFGHGSRAAAEHADFADLQRQSRKEERVSDSDKYSERKDGQSEFLYDG